MTYTTVTTPSLSHTEFTTVAEKIAAYYTEFLSRRAIKNTYKELNLLTDRELQDIGLERASIYNAAVQSSYKV